MKSDSSESILGAKTFCGSVDRVDSKLDKNDFKLKLN